MKEIVLTDKLQRPSALSPANQVALGLKEKLQLFKEQQSLRREIRKDQQESAIFDVKSRTEQIKKLIQKQRNPNIQQTLQNLEEIQQNVIKKS